MQSEEEVSRSSISKPRFAGPILIHRQRTSGAGDDDSREQEQEKLRQFGFVDERSAHEDEVVFVSCKIKLLLSNDPTNPQSMGSPPMSTETG